MPTPSPTPTEFHQCLVCRRGLTSERARRRGYGPVCWRRWSAVSHLAPDDPRRIQALPTLPLFSEVVNEAS